jgi:Ion channel
VLTIAVGSALAGGALIGLTFYDIIATVLHPQVQSPISNRIHRLGWQVLRLVAERLRSSRLRHALLGWGLPLLISGLIALWVFLLILGFALIYAPWLGDPTSFAIPAESHSSLTDAIYYSGTSLTTVGYGDFQATRRIFRALSVVEAASGFVVISLSVAYLLALYPALARVQALAVALDAEVAGQPGALPLVRRYLATEGGWEGDLANRLRELALALLDVTGVHETHPVLYYAHSRQPHHSFLRVLVTAQGLVGQCRYGLSPDRHGGVVRNPQLALLEQSLLYALRRLSASLHIPNIEREDTADGCAALAADFEQICRDLDRLGLVSALDAASAPVAPILDASADDPARDQGDDESRAQRGRRANGAFDWGVGDPAYDDTAPSPTEAYITFRQETDPHLQAYASACGYTLDEARQERRLA